MKKNLLGLFLLLACGVAFTVGNSLNYGDQGGDTWHVGGGLEVESGGSIDFESGSSMKFAGVASDKIQMVEKQTLAAVSTGGGVVSWANPTGGTIVITRAIFNLTTASTAAATVDCGVAANATTSNDTLIDGLDVNAAAGIFDNTENGGSNGKNQVKATSSQYVTCSRASGETAGLAGSMYIYYHVE
jgi:hypothetical protein